MLNRFPYPLELETLKGQIEILVGAPQAIKRKKRHEAQLAQIDGTLTTMEQQREALEGANTNTAVLQTMGEAAKSLKKAHEGRVFVPI